MKALSMITGLALVAMSSVAQTSNLNVTFRGANNNQISIDGNLYSSANYSTNTNGNRVFSITDLTSGQHTLSVLNSYNRQVGTTTTFTLRPGYDMNISVNSRGGISLNERRSRTTTGTYNNAMNASSFNSLVAQVNARRGQSNKFYTANSAISASTNYFTSAQVGQLLSLMNGQSYRLQLAKNAYAHIVDPSNVSSVFNMLNSTSARSELQNYINTYNSANGIPGSSTGTGTGYHTAVTAATFNSLVSSVRNKWLPGAKMSELTNIFSNTSYYFTSEQAKQLISMVSDEANRLQLAKSSYRSIVDPANFLTVYDLLASQASRNELDLYVRSASGNGSWNGGGYNNGSTNNNNGYRTAMMDADYTTLVNDVKGRWLPGAKMSALTTIMANTSYNFTANQALGLIQLVSDETNRLSLAKSAMARLVDPANYTVMYNLFSTQSSRDELDIYARNYR